MKPKKVSESALQNQVYIVFPEDLNAKNLAFGGRVLEKADRIAATVARRHHGKECLTLGMDSVRFLAPAKQGDLLWFNAAITRTWNTSMEIEVTVYVESSHSKNNVKLVMSAYFTFVAIDKNLNPTKVRPAIPETDEEKRRFREADMRRRKRLENQSKVL